MEDREEREPFTKNGYCHDCAEGLVTPATHGFAQYIDDDGEAQFWYCRYCGSNHVTLVNEDGTTAHEEGDLY